MQVWLDPFTKSAPVQNRRIYVCLLLWLVRKRVPGIVALIVLYPRFGEPATSKHVIGYQVVYKAA